MGGSLKGPEYVRSTVERRLAEDERPGMETGIAEKSGNADGVKVSTAVNRERGNIRYTTGVGNG